MTPLDLPAFLDYAGHAATLILGLAVLAAAPRKTPNQGFALYVFATTARPLGFVVASTTGFDWNGYTIWFHVLWTQILAALGLILLARAFPTPLEATDRQRVIAATIIGAATAAAWALWGLPYSLTTGGGPAWVAYGIIVGALPIGITAGFLSLLALRANKQSGSVAPHATVTVAIALPWAMEIARRLGIVANRPAVYAGDQAVTIGVTVATLGVLTLLWLRNIHAGANSRWALVAALCAPATAVAGVVGWSTLTGGADWAGAVSNVVIILATAGVGYAIARGQVPGLAGKVRWGVSRGTIAAAFVAAFFVASEGAQILFGGGNEWVGLFAAGALVFAIAPLQRAAERLAEKAVPSTALAPGGASSREEVYAAAARRYLRDGVLSRNDERELAHLAGELGLHAGRAMEILDEIGRGGREVST